MAEFNRTIEDAALKVTTALPAQNTNNNTASIDLGPGNGADNYANENVVLNIALPATPSLADGQTITLTLQDSADDSSFATVAAVATIVATGAGGAGAAAITREIRLPVGTRRYIRFNQAASVTAADNTAVSTTWKLLF